MPPSPPPSSALLRRPKPEPLDSPERPPSPRLPVWASRRRARFTPNHIKSETATKKKRSLTLWIKQETDPIDPTEPPVKKQIKLEPGVRVDRWSAERYQTAEIKLLSILRAMDARMGTPVQRQAVRAEARKQIGDTGLLDHLLKHMVGRTVAGGRERLCRRHNAEGTMEYWLEPAEMREIRVKAGVKDPYWVPPIGWKVGDSTVGCECGEECVEEAGRIREEVAGVKRDFQGLVYWKSEMEKEMNGMSSCLRTLKEEMRLMKEEKYKKQKFVAAAAFLQAR